FDERDLPGERTRRERADVTGPGAAECALVGGDVLGGYHLRRPERCGELRTEVRRTDREPGEVRRYRCGRGDVDLAGHDRRVLGDRADTDHLGRVRRGVDGRLVGTGVAGGEHHRDARVDRVLGGLHHRVRPRGRVLVGGAPRVADDVGATVTLLLVNRLSPFGKPFGALNPVSSKHWLPANVPSAFLRTKMPESTIATFTPLPAFACPPTWFHSTGAPIWAGVLNMSA